MIKYNIEVLSENEWINLFDNKTYMKESTAKSIAAKHSRRFNRKVRIVPVEIETEIEKLQNEISQLKSKNYEVESGNFDKLVIELAEIREKINISFRLLEQPVNFYQAQTLCEERKNWLKEVEELRGEQ